jgi:hypothetical protein
MEVAFFETFNFPPQEGHTREISSGISLSWWLFALIIEQNIF